MELTALALWLNTTFAAVDLTVAQAINDLLFTHSGSFIDIFLKVASSLLDKGGIIMILLSFVLIWFPKTRKFGTAMLAALAIGALITNLLFKPLAARPRPYLEEGVLRDIFLRVGWHPESDKSFPSGHVNAAMAVAVAVFLVGDKRVSWTAFFFALFVGVSRVYLGVHYFSDVLGGYFTGTVGGVAGYIISVKVPEVWYMLDFSAVLHKKGLPGGQKGRHQK